MKHTILQITGCLLIVFFCANMGIRLVTNELAWLSFLFFGIMAFGIGSYIEYKNEKPLSSYEIKRRKQQLATCRNLILCSLIGLIFIIVSLISRL